MINVTGMKIRSVNPGAIYPKNGAWRYSVVINGMSWESSEPYTSAPAAKQDMRQEVTRLRCTHVLEATA